MSADTPIGKNMSENKPNLIKAVKNIIKKLQTATGLKKEKYMSLVRKEFNLGKNEKWVTTKLRMILVRLDAGLGHLQIRQSENPRKEKSQSVLREAIKRKSNAKNRTSQDKYTATESPSNYFRNNIKETARKHTKSSKNQRKSLESRQLEKLRNTEFADDEDRMASSWNKVVFLRTLKLQPQAICL
jgi:hypothetical protein